jgi:hypothetical protein
MKASLKHFHEKFKGKVSIQRVMNAAGIWWPQMPKWDRYYNHETNQDELCWNQVIGCCRFGSECKFARSHAEARKLPSDFEDNAIKAMKPGIDAMLKDDYKFEDLKAKFQGGGGGGAGRGGYYGPSGGDYKRLRR